MHIAFERQVELSLGIPKRVPDNEVAVESRSRAFAKDSQRIRITIAGFAYKTCFHYVGFCRVRMQQLPPFMYGVGGGYVEGPGEKLVSPKLTRFPQAHSTDVVSSSLCPPRRWSDAGVGINMLRGAGDSLT